MKHISNSKVSGVIWNAIGSIAFAANSFVLQWLVSFFLDLEEVGKFGLAFATAQLLYVVGNFGVNIFQMMDYNRKYSLAEYVGVRVVSSDISIFGCGAYIIFAGHGFEKSLLIILMSAYMLLYSFVDAFQCQLFVNGRMDLSGKSVFYRTTVSLILFGITLWLTHNQIYATIIAILGNVLVSLWTLKILNKIEPIVLRLEMRKVKALLVICIPMFVSTMLYSYMNNISKYYIEHLYGDTMLGIYTIVFVPIMIVSLICNFVFKPLYPKINDLQKNSRKMFWFTIKITGMIIFFTVICCILMKWIGVYLLQFIFTVDIREYFDLCVISVLAGGFSAINNFFHNIIIALKKQKAMMWVTVLGAIILSVISLFFVKTAGISGAVWSYAVSYIVLVIMMFAIILVELFRRRKLDERNMD